MGRNKANAKKAGGSGAGKAAGAGAGAGATKPAINKSKKAKNLFKVNNAKSNKKKPKEVQGKLKQIKETVKSKQEKVDATLKVLHKDMVVKKPKPSVPSIKNSRKPPANTTKVSDSLGKLKF
ncbi:uncharacterized protein LOC117567086 [Drosophila albomicans]|uniref:Uncharacterized protein LOC117567086 n=1 Tax=Drosophila albomicans TaxID=7291 RepID=A0A6P8WTM6_DROAB|nr:uncharacterized protein LOC117567086 [Drosophila albomicans]